MIGRVVRVRIETPLGGFVKRRGDGRIDFVTPVPSPYNYGFVPEVEGGDGNLDAIVLGPRLPVGHEALFTVHAILRFVDAGIEDDKLICGRAPTAAERRGLAVFFRTYALFKRVLHRVRGRSGRTAFLGLG